MFHIGKSFHELAVLSIFRDGRQHELVILSSVIEEHKANLLALANLDSCGIKKLFFTRLFYLYFHVPEAAERLKPVFRPRKRSCLRDSCTAPDRDNGFRRDPRELSSP